MTTIEKLDLALDNLIQAIKVCHPHILIEPKSRKELDLATAIKEAEEARKS